MGGTTGGLGVRMGERALEEPSPSVSTFVFTFSSVLTDVPTGKPVVLTYHLPPKDVR